MKRFISIILIMSFLLIGCGAEKVEAYSITYDNVEYTYEDLGLLFDKIVEQTNKMGAALKMNDAAYELGYSAEHYVVKLSNEEYKKASELCEIYSNIYDDLLEHWLEKETEYPDAAYVWTYFRDLGYSEAVCAGLLGNMMIECGNQTLNLKWDVYNPNKFYYGICQWNKTDYSEIHGASLKEQCDFLRDTIEYEINACGFRYKKGFTYEDFLALTNPQEAALAFSKCYERNNADSYKARERAAQKAYEYFIS